MKNSGRKDIGERIRLIRIKKGMTQEEIGKLIGRSAAVISSYETGKRCPPTKQVDDLSKALGVSVDYLLGREVEGKKVSYDIGNVLEAETLLYDGRVLTPRQKEFLKQQLEFIFDQIQQASSQ
ncbi:helix-turn-helix domain-containing protein [Thermoflavimicrobium daqui]|jgi:transcriptional regulator with XRE-family HTH domain|uniref:Transcriptional regulator n=1 Tax=Thermoflavimicrobium daqui TaxID=2137476 RepID=A0A364K1N5_9BACL|nr:helix-turn-helix transcriptional regulator [Thermoflavimicrobium daqui]RAL21939.1 transcriptional regulator [Thermoflavimicrobium daqui]